MDKAELIRHEIEKRRVHNLAIGNPLFAAMAEEDIELLSFIDSLQEEPVSEDLEEAANEIVNKAIPPLAVKYKDGTYVGRIRDCFDRKEFIDLVKAGAQWQKTKDESTTEDLGDYINELSKQFPEVSFAKLSRIAVRAAKWHRDQIEEALLSEVLPCFMHGGEADEVVAKLDEVLKQK